MAEQNKWKKVRRGNTKSLAELQEIKEVIDNKYPEEEKKKEVPKEPTIHDKYRKHINQVKDGYLRGLDYDQGMEILRWMEKETGHTIPMNFSCGTCLIDLIIRFSNLEK